MVDRLAAGFYASDRTGILPVLRQIVHLAQSRILHDDFLYAEVAEEGNPRRSYDMNLYQAKLPLAGMRSQLAALFERFELPAPELERVYETVQDQILGHLSGGTERQGRDFLTFYFARP